MWIAVSIILAVIAVGLTIGKTSFLQNARKRIIHQYRNQRDFDADKVDAVVESNMPSWPVPGLVNTAIIGLAVMALVAGIFHKVFFYAEPGYIYHVRTITGQERVIDGVGYSFYGFGRINPWKKAVTVQAAANIGATAVDQVSDDENDTVSANLQMLNIVFLDQVDADASATARFRLPTDQDTFLALAHEYRTASNFLRTELVPAFRETLQASASLMSAEEYFSGGRTEFNTEFENQLQQGIYIVKRTEEVVYDTTQDQEGSANASKGATQDNFGDNKKVIFKVKKLYEKDGVTPRRKEQKFIDFGVELVAGRVTDMDPNDKFKTRMEQKQQASADRAIAREKRIQEEEQRLLAIAKGDREVAERQAVWKADQIEQTTKAETDKQLALTAANKQKEQAAIDKDTSGIRLEQAKLDAEKQRTLADAEAYEKRSLLEADNALQAKLDAEQFIQKVWADAYARRAVPQYVMGSGGSNGAPVGGDSEVSNFMSLMTMMAAKQLNYDRSVQKAN